MPKRMDLSNKQFGKWLVLSYVGNSHWKCKCLLCNNIYEVYRGSLTKGLSSCCKECSLKIQAQEKLTNQSIQNEKFGEWTVLKYLGYGKALCRCSCENQTIKEVDISNLRSGASKSCGCKRRELAKDTLIKRYGETSPVKVYNPREPWQIDILENKDKLREFILRNFTPKPTFYELADKLNVSRHRISVKIHEYMLENLIDIEPLTSKGERELAQFIKDIYNGKVEESVKNIIHPYELDIYLPDINIAIEFNGSYWHSDEKVEKLYHQNKTILCRKNNIRLIHIFEYEWNNKQEKIKKYLKNLLCSNKSIKYARHLIIKQISNKEAIDFCNKYHLQGAVSSDINIALIDEQEIIGVMTLGIPRFNNNFEYELHRLVYKDNTIVVGGTEKMFKYFINKYNPSSIISYCDASKFDGDIYNKIGFTRDTKISEPSYVWVDTKYNIVLTRYQTMKHKLVSKGIGTEDQTEDEIMRLCNYLKIYDSGNYKFYWYKKSFK